MGPSPDSTCSFSRSACSFVIAVRERLVDLREARVAEGLLEIRGVHAEALRHVVEKGLAHGGVVVALRLCEGHAAEDEEGHRRCDGDDAFGGSRGRSRCSRNGSTVTSRSGS